MKSLQTRIFWLTAFSIAMGYLEAAVVVYLRKIYCPGGFHFPLTPMEPGIGMTEFWREASTIIMLLAIGILAGKNTSQKFGIFIFCFAIWDTFYYIFLKLLLGWPESLFTWDILFAIPVPWIGPVLAPCLLSLTMIILSMAVIYYQERGIDVHLKAKEWIVLSVGSLVVIISFTQDFLKYSGAYDGPTIPGKDRMYTIFGTYIPITFNWWIFIAGETLILAGIISFINRARALKQKVI
jgi:hypothetical protein